MDEELIPNIDSEEVGENEDFLSNFCELPIEKFQGKRGGGSDKLSFSIVNSKRNGKRVTLSGALFRALGQPEEVAISFKDGCLAIAPELPSVTERYKFSPTKDTHIIYNMALILAIAESFSLDFTGRCSITFTKIKLKHFKNSDGVEVPYAVINMIS